MIFDLVSYLLGFLTAFILLVILIFIVGIIGSQRTTPKNLYNKYV